MSKSIRRRQSDSHNLMARLLEMPALAGAVTRLQPDVLHRIIRHCGLEDCGALLTLATPGQLRTLADLDLWTSPGRGAREQFDADRFGVWLEVLVESGADAAAERLTALEVPLAITAFAHYLRVFDPATLAERVPSGDDDRDPITRAGNAFSCDIGGYLVVARRGEAWDAICSLLAALDTDHPDYFHAVMTGCRRLSNAGFELDGLDDLLDASDQTMFDVAIDRDRRREQAGYVTPADARAFLATARAVTRTGAAPPPNRLAADYFRGIGWATPDASAHASRAAVVAAGAEDASATVTAILEVLVDEGVLQEPPRARLGGGNAEPARLDALQRYLMTMTETTQAARSQDLVYLANVLMTGCAVQEQPLRASLAHDLAMATCNLGLECWPPRWNQPDDLVCVFQLGWSTLHTEVGMLTAKRLLAILRELPCPDPTLRADLGALQRSLSDACRAGEPWRAVAALDVIQSVDAIAWVALAGLVSDPPVMHAGIVRHGRAMRSVSVSDVAPIAGRDQIRAIHGFLDSLPDRLRI